MPKEISAHESEKSKDATCDGDKTRKKNNSLVGVCHGHGGWRWYGGVHGAVGEAGAAVDEAPGGRGAPAAPVVQVRRGRMLLGRRGRAAPALVPQLLFAPPLCSAVAEPNLLTTRTLVSPPLTQNPPSLTGCSWCRSVFCLRLRRPQAPTTQNHSFTHSHPARETQQIVV
jgi:hypothetical protein